MKTLLIILVLLFSSSVFAEDVSDFQIEEMSIGDSLLNYFSESEIRNNKIDYPFINNKFYAVGFKETSFKVYEVIEIYLKTNDKKYIIYSIQAGIFYEKNINDCYAKKDEIVAELTDIFKGQKLLIMACTSILGMNLAKVKLLLFILILSLKIL